MFNHNQIGLDYHRNFAVKELKLNELIEKIGKQAALELDWDANDEYDGKPRLLYRYSNHKEQVRSYKSNYPGNIAIATVVKEYAVHGVKKYIEEYRMPVAKPILKVKSEDWKSRALKAEAKLSEKDNKIKSLEQGNSRLKDENTKLKSVAKQAFLNQVNLMKAVGIEVTQEDLDL